MITFYDLKHVADVLGISVKALRIRVSKGKMPNADKRQGDNLFWTQETLRKANILIGQDNTTGGLRRGDVVVVSSPTPATLSQVADRTRNA